MSCGRLCVEALQLTCGPWEWPWPWTAIAAILLSEARSSQQEVLFALLSGTLPFSAKTEPAPQGRFRLYVGCVASGRLQGCNSMPESDAAASPFLTVSARVSEPEDG